MMMMMTRVVLISRLMSNWFVKRIQSAAPVVTSCFFPSFSAVIYRAWPLPLFT